MSGSDYTTIAILVLSASLLAVFILAASAFVGPRRIGRRKHGAYESGMEPVGDTRRRFNVAFYMVAVLFLIFDVELIFFYPWAVLFPRMQAESGTPEAASVQPLIEAGYGPGFMLTAIGIFFGLLLVGFIYEWRRGVFKWN